MIHWDFPVFLPGSNLKYQSIKFKDSRDIPENRQRLNLNINPLKEGGFSRREKKHKKKQQKKTTAQSQKIVLKPEVSNISFVDLDLDLRELGGNISWIEPSLSRRVAWIGKDMISTVGHL